MQKKGTLLFLLIIDWQPTIFFTFFQDVQYRTLLQAIADIKAAIRYIRKDYDNGNLLGIDPDVIFVGGYSAGAVLSIHLAYVDNISDLPTSPVDVQALVSDIGGTLEGDSGNNGYSSNVSAIISFTGGINNLSFIDPLTNHSFCTRNY